MHHLVLLASGVKISTYNLNKNKSFMSSCNLHQLNFACTKLVINDSLF